MIKRQAATVVLVALVMALGSVPASAATKTITIRVTGMT